MMTDLREKIVDIFCNWHEDETAESVADRIIALLPKVPELRWDDDDNLMLGNLYTGDVRENWGDNRWSGYTSEVVISSATKQKAIAAVEAAVRKALGWEA